MHGTTNLKFKSAVHTEGCGGGGGGDINILCSFSYEEMSIGNLEFPVKNAASGASTEKRSNVANKSNQHSRQ
jgi:hypothetical protein